ncbi:MAG: FxSxx-COOH system tetratricopeptide repeat protein [Actinomycetota bacterium]|nr:FxSxx-COOH system tetratricopeptide repeat protein [Actinomycetota bacterium]
MADAVWLTSVTQDAWRRHTGILSESGPDDRIKPSGLPTDQPAKPELPTRSWEDGRRANRDTVDRRVNEACPLPTDLGGVPLPAALPLPSSADIVRALRPLKRKVLSWHEDEVVLDEDATAEQAVQDGLWLPVTKPGTARWLDLTLVVDASPSMALWQSTVTAFISLSQRLGAFRTIQLRLLDTHHPTGGSPATPVLRGGTPATPTRSPAELLDPSGRRIVLVLTDGVGQCWRQDLVSPLLAQWGGVMPVAVVHLLPQRLWERDGVALHRARLTVPGPLSPNRRWGLELSDSWLDPDPAAAVPGGVVPVPVLELEARWLGWWARFVTGSFRDPADATVLLAGNQAREPASFEGANRQSDDGSPDGKPSAHEQVLHFLSVASPAAFRLATLLAAVPVSVPVARLVQAELVPESGPDHLAEVFTSGLLRPSDTAAGGRAWDTITFDVLDAVREELLSGARRSETAHVVHLVTERFGDQVTVLRQFRDALDAPDSTPDPELTADTAHYVAVERTVMRALSGPYLSRADRLHSSMQDRSVTSSALASSAGAPESNLTGAQTSNTDTMSAMTDRTDLASELARPLTSVLDSPVNDVEPLGEPAAVDTSTATHPGPLTGPAPVTPRERQADDVPPVWGNVPPRNPNFTGRAELLDRLGERLTAGGATAVLPAALHGMGGIGKTQMAVEYIYRHLHEYDVIWWIQATQQAQVRAGLTELAQRLRLPGSSEAHTAVPAVREALRIGQPFRRWLLVFDSAESPEVVRPFFPANGPGEILITSRNPDWAGIARPLEVAVFKREEAKELLRRRGPDIDDEEADRLAEALGDLPLAIEQAAAWRAETGMPVREYLRLFDEKVAEILDTSAPADYEVSVAAAWNVSFDELRTRNPAAHELLQVCAFFAPEPISRNLFVGIRGVSISPELDAALRDPMQLSRTIRDINRYGLAKIDHRNDTLLLHRLVQLVLSNRMTPQRWAQMRHGAHLLLANLDPNDPVPSQQWPRYQDVLPHAYAAKVIECDDRWVRHLVVNLMRFLYYWGDHEEAAGLARQAVDVWTEKLGEADLQTLQAARNLGFYLWTLGRYAEAARVNQRTVERHRQVSGENSEETTIAELAVATDLKGRGDFIAALDLNEQIYQKAKGLFGDDDPTTLTTAHDLVVSLGLAGQYSRGRELGEDTHRRRADVLGYDNPSTISTLNALILARREAGDYVWARLEQEKLAERSRELFGADKAATLRRFHHLSVARRKDGDHQSALELSAQVLERFRLRYGDNHPNAMACALAQSIDLRHAGAFGPARKLGEQTFDRYRQSLGESHPHTLSALLDLAVTLRLFGDAAGAQQLDERSLEQFRATLGPDHPHAIVSAINLASDLAAQGETKAALALNTEALDRANRVLGTEHPTTLAAVTNLVLDLRTVDRTQEAETRYAEVVTRYRHMLGDAHPATMAAASGVRADCDIDPLPL